MQETTHEGSRTADETTHEGAPSTIPVRAMTPADMCGDVGFYYQEVNGRWIIIIDAPVDDRSMDVRVRHPSIDGDVMWTSPRR